MERVMGIEPTSQAWEARILPMNYTRISEGIIARGRRKINPFLSLKKALRNPHFSSAVLLIYGGLHKKTEIVTMPAGTAVGHMWNWNNFLFLRKLWLKKMP